MGHAQGGSGGGTARARPVDDGRVQPAPRPVQRPGPVRGLAEPGRRRSPGQSPRRPVQGISGYTSQSSWAAIGEYQPPATSLRLYLGVAMSPTGGSPAQTPANLGVFQQLAQNLVNGGQSYAILRVGWEWSTTYFSWGVQNTTPGPVRDGLRRHRDHHAQRRRAALPLRLVRGRRRDADQRLVRGVVPRRPVRRLHRHGPVRQLHASSWADTLDTVGGLSYTVDFAKAHGKFVSVPEWGLNGVDDPAFINVMYGFIVNPNNDVGYSSYFSYDGVDQLRHHPVPELPGRLHPRLRLARTRPPRRAARSVRQLAHELVEVEVVPPRRDEPAVELEGAHDRQAHGALGGHEMVHPLGEHDIARRPRCGAPRSPPGPSRR